MLKAGKTLVGTHVIDNHDRVCQGGSDVRVMLHEPLNWMPQQGIGYNSGPYC